MNPYLQITRSISTLLFIMTFSSLIWAKGKPPPPPVIADMVVTGDVYTVNPAQPWAEAIAIKEGEIIFVGTQANAQNFINPSTQMMNVASGGMVLPGLHDIHIHALEGGDLNIGCLLDQNQSVNQWVNKVTSCANSSSSPWVLGFGHDIGTLISDGRSPKELLDLASTTTPIAIMEWTSHSAWVNSKALEILGFDASTANPSGGHIGISQQTGEANGILLDTAGDMAFHTALDNPTTDMLQVSYDGLLWSLNKIRQAGITSIGNARVYWKRGYLDVWQRARDEGTLTARTTLALWAYPEDSDMGQIATLKSMYNDSDPMLKTTQIKIYSDGLIGNTTAAILAPYLDDIGLGLTSNTGLNYFNEARIKTYTTKLQKAGFDMHVHAIGDRGVHETLNAYENSMPPNHNYRHRITHLEQVDTADRGRFAELGVIADMQVAGEWTLPGQQDPEEIHLLGQERMDQQIPMRDIYNSGAVVTMSSDWDVSSMSPFVGMQHALERGEQSLPNVAAAIEAYTINAAYALRQEHLVGSIEVGKRADFTIINQNLFNVPTQQIGGTNVVRTIVDGNVVN